MEGVKSVPQNACHVIDKADMQAYYGIYLGAFSHCVIHSVHMYCVAYIV
jgi:hypothetical protein